MAPRMTRRVVVVGCLLALAVAFGAGLAVAHGNHATAHPQVSANGTLVVEQVFLTEPGYLVVRADDDGTPGRVLGSRSLDQGFYTGVSVSFDASHWENVTGNTTVWTVLHADDGDGQFDPATDDLLYWFGDPAGDRFSVGKRSGAGYVVTGGGSGTTTGELLVSRVALPEAGHVVVHEQANGSLGRVRGSQPLSAGTHSDVRVPVNLTANRSQWPPLSVAIYTDDGDGTLDSADSVVRVAGDPVASPLGRQRAVPTRSPGIVTPTPGNPSTAEPTTARGETDASPTTSADGAGFGVPVTVIAGVLVVLAARRRA